MVYFLLDRKNVLNMGHLLLDQLWLTGQGKGVITYMVTISRCTGKDSTFKPETESNKILHTRAIV